MLKLIKCSFFINMKLKLINAVVAFVTLTSIDYTSASYMLEVQSNSNNNHYQGGNKFISPEMKLDLSTRFNYNSQQGTSKQNEDSTSRQNDLTERYIKINNSQQSVNKIPDQILAQYSNVYYPNNEKVNQNSIHNSHQQYNSLPYNNNPYNQSSVNQSQFTSNGQLDPQSQQKSHYQSSQNQYYSINKNAQQKYSSNAKYSDLSLTLSQASQEHQKQQQLQIPDIQSISPNSLEKNPYSLNALSSNNKSPVQINKENKQDKLKNVEDIRVSLANARSMIQQNKDNQENNNESVNLMNLDGLLKIIVKINDTYEMQSSSLKKICNFIDEFAEKKETEKIKSITQRLNGIFMNLKSGLTLQLDKISNTIQKTYTDLSPQEIEEVKMKCKLIKLNENDSNNENEYQTMELGKLLQDVEEFLNTFPMLSEIIELHSKLREPVYRDVAEKYNSENLSDRMNAISEMLRGLNEALLQKSDVIAVLHNKPKLLEIIKKNDPQVDNLLENTQSSYVNRMKRLIQNFDYKKSRKGFAFSLIEMDPNDRVIDGYFYEGGYEGGYFDCGLDMIYSCIIQDTSDNTSIVTKGRIAVNNTKNPNAVHDFLTKYAVQVRYFCENCELVEAPVKRVTTSPDIRGFDVDNYISEVNISNTEANNENFALNNEHSVNYKNFASNRSNSNNQYTKKESKLPGSTMSARHIKAKVQGSQMINDNNIKVSEYFSINNCQSSQYSENLPQQQHFAQQLQYTGSFTQRDYIQGNQNRFHTAGNEPSYRYTDRSNTDRSEKSSGVKYHQTQPDYQTQVNHQTQSNLYGNQYNSVNINQYENQDNQNNIKVNSNTPPASKKVKRSFSKASNMAQKVSGSQYSNTYGTWE